MIPGYECRQILDTSKTHLEYHTVTTIRTLGKPPLEKTMAGTTAPMNQDKQTRGPQDLDTARTALVAKIATIENQMARLSEDLALSKKALELIDELVRRGGAAVPPHSTQSIRATRRRRRSDGGPTASELIREASYEALLQANHPLDRNELLKVLTEKGVVIPGEDPAKFIGRVLWRSDLFENDGDGYCLADRPRTAIVPQDLS